MKKESISKDKSFTNVKFGGFKFCQEEVYAHNIEYKSCMTLIQNKV